MDSDIKITISVPTKFHAFRLVEGLDRRRLLDKLYTVYPKFKIPPYNISLDRVKSFPFLGALKYANRFLKNIIFLDEIMSNIFDIFVSLSLKRPAGSWIFHSWSGFCEKSLSKAKKIGGVAVVERSCPHIDFQRKILEEEEYLLTGKKPDYAKNAATDARMKREYEIADYIVVPSQYSYRSFIKRGFDSSKIIIVPLCNEKLTSPVVKPKNDGIFKVLCVGGNFYRKGIFYLLKAWQALNLKDARLIIKGEIPEESPGLLKSDGVQLISYHLSNEDIVRLYQEADIFVLPSVDDGFGMVVAETMAAGLPVIVTENVERQIILKTAWKGL